MHLASASLDPGIDDRFGLIPMTPEIGLLRYVVARLEALDLFGDQLDLINKADFTKRLDGGGHRNLGIVLHYVPTKLKTGTTWRIRSRLIG